MAVPDVSPCGLSSSDKRFSGSRLLVEGWTVVANEVSVWIDVSMAGMLVGFSAGDGAGTARPRLRFW